VKISGLLRKTLTGSASFAGALPTREVQYGGATTPMNTVRCAGTLSVMVDANILTPFQGERYGIFKVYVQAYSKK